VGDIDTLITSSELSRVIQEVAYLSLFGLDRILLQLPIGCSIFVHLLDDHLIYMSLSINHFEAVAFDNLLLLVVDAQKLSFVVDSAFQLVLCGIPKVCLHQEG
jgi:hypothetical protein